MNGAHLHLLLNHLPIVGTYAAVLVLAGGYIFKSPVIRQTGLSIIVVAALLSVPAFLTGDPAEDVLKASGQANEKFIEVHEELAEGTLYVCIGCGTLALVALITSARKMRIANALTFMALITSIICSILWFRVGNSGGEIRHPEIRSSNSLHATDND
jgi:uncharacterized membrane protein